MIVSSSSLIIVIPAYNEDQIIEKVIKDWLNLSNNIDYKILIINDDSTQTIHIWPGSSFSDVIDGGSADAVDGNTLAAGASRRYIAVDSTNWYTA